MRFIALVLLFGIMWVLQALHLGIFENVIARSTMSIGFIIFAGLLIGELAGRLWLPKITGYIAAGILCGPYLLGFLNEDVVNHLQLINDLALSLIAFTAGGELRADRLRGRIGSILSITGFQTIIGVVGVVVCVFLLKSYIPFLSDQVFGVVLTSALILGVIAVATSPSTTIAVIVETRSKGQMTDTVLGATVLKDVVVLLMFSIVLAAADVLINPSEGFSLEILGHEIFSIILSLACGAILGILMSLYFKYIGRELVIFIIAFACCTIIFSELLNLHFLLMCIAAGFVVENFTSRGQDMVSAIELGSLPVYIIFFTIAGAGLNFLALKEMWYLAGAFVVVRMIVTFAGSYIGSIAARDNKLIRRSAWMGFIAQAGVSLGLANMIAEMFPSWGLDVRTLVVAAIAINQIIGPVLFKVSLWKAKELGQVQERTYKFITRDPSLVTRDP